MDDIVHFIGLTYDKSRSAASSEDVILLVEALQNNGFAVSEPISSGPGQDGGPTLEVWREGFGSTVSLETDWMIQILTNVELVDVIRDEETGRRGVEQLAHLVGTVAGMADSYLGFISNDAEDDLSFVGEDRPVEITEPLALVYFGRRYLDDWGSAPTFAAGAEFTAELPNGLLVVPSLEGLG